MSFDNALLKEIKEKLDLREVVEKELGEGKPSGETLRWVCPFHPGHNRTAFSVSKHQYRCWACEASGDVITWFEKRNNLDFKAAVEQAARAAGISLKEAAPPHLSPSRPRRPIRPVRPLLNPPSSDWQQSNHYYVKQCESYLWSEVNQPALDYLHRRGLQDETIKRAHLGYDPGRNIIVIPWYIEGELWRLGTKSPVEGGKAPLFAGFKQGLYNADRLTPGQPALLLEGEFDALIVEQEAGDLVVPVATGGVTSGRQVQWVSRLVKMPCVMVAFDNDTAGEKAAQWWLTVLPHNARRYRPLGAKDPNDMFMKAGMNLRQWLGELPDLDTETADEPEQSGWRRWLKK